MSDQVTYFVRYTQAGGSSQTTLSMVGARSHEDAARRLTRFGTADIVGSVEVWAVEQPPKVFRFTLTEDAGGDTDA